MHRFDSIAGKRIVIRDQTLSPKSVLMKYPVAFRFVPPVVLEFLHFVNNAN